LLSIVCWHWGKKYNRHYVERLKTGLEIHIQQEFRFGIFSPEKEDEYLTKIPGCFCRLRMFDPEWQEKHGFKDRIVSIDLDTIITGPLDDLFDRPENFVILQGANAANPCPYNGSIFMLRAGYRPDVWRDFSIKRSQEIKFHEFPDDQGWFWDKMPTAAGWKAGPESGIYAFQKPGWPKGDELPKGCKIVSFPGWRDPGNFLYLEWVRNNWLV
jgi:hypothetical protein